MSAFPTHLRNLLQPDAYPHPVRALELLETHVSWVLLTGEFAYKIKRPVQFAFVDQRSPERRAQLCQEEVRLNRRFAPQLYLGVCPITLQQGKARLAGQGPACEHAVQMRQFAPEQELDRLLATECIEPAELAAFGHELARIHRKLPVADATQPWGRPETLASVITDNATECAQAGAALGETLPPALLAALAQRLADARVLLAARFAAGLVRECHGDLHARNVVRVDGSLYAFDCLEFAPALRWTDVADDLAFLLADLEARQYPRHAQALLGGYLEACGDYPACRLLPLFKTSRALVRAKIAALRALDPANGAAAAAARAEYRRYVTAACCTLAGRAAPTLYITCGLSGSGKSWLAHQLAPHVRAVHLRSDLERKRLAGVAPLERRASGLAAGIYSATASARLYEQLAHDAADILAAGSSVIVDATFATRERRAIFRKLAAQLGVRLCVLYCHAPAPLLQGRLRERARRADDPSDAGPAVLEWQQSHFEPIDAGEQLEVFDVATSEPQAIERLLERLPPQPTVPAR